VRNLSNYEDDYDLDDEECAELDECGEWIPNGYYRLPSKREINQYGMMEEFCEIVSNPSIRKQLWEAIDGRGAFSRFRNVIHKNGLEKQWNRFEHECFKKIAIAFCQEIGCKYKLVPRQLNE
jgi:hypothetical protein